MSQLICNDLSIGYEGHPVLEHINFVLEPSDYLCILGANGSGKSTLMKTILGLQPPLSGSITLENSKEIGYLPQQTAMQKDFPASVYEVVQSGCLASCGLRPFYSKVEKQRAHDAMAQLGLTSLAKRCYRELSGGQQERVLLARALCTTRKMLLLDEPASGLDPEITAELYTLLGNLNQQEKVTIIMISHDLSASFTYATKILHLGASTFFGTKEDYFAWKAQQGGDVL